MAVIPPNFDREAFLRELFMASVEAARPERAVRAHLPPYPKGRTVVIGAGKASAAMATALEDAWDGPLEGLVATRYGHAAPTRRVEIIEAAHPVPDRAGEEAARRMIDLVTGLGPDDRVIALVSGGGSALLALPPPGVASATVAELYVALLSSGADIAAMNTVRKHLSLALGGRLAAACPDTPMSTLVVSDVPGDDMGVVGSGPTVPDKSTRAGARRILEQYGIAAASEILSWLKSPESETPKASHPCFRNKTAAVVASPVQSLLAAADLARKRGYAPLILGDAIEGEAREVAKVHAGIVRSVLAHSLPLRPPCVLLSGGETTVTVRGDGRGGRNAEFALALAVALGSMDGVHALAADTDGIDGSEDNAGALVLPGTLAAAFGRDPVADLDRNDAYGFFAAAGGLVMTGPTRTNVNDFRAILIDG
jgi:hydroxypyruvate reductase